MSEPSKPVFTLEELTDRQKQIIKTLDTALREMHAQLDITAGEAIAALTAVAYHLSMSMVAVYYEIDPPKDVP
jgi:hypothetical protein